jgi:AAA domain, putative AbiEii toxin, Type IV TA system
MRHVTGALLREIRAVNFRSARRLTVRPGPICALIGEPGAGKSNVLLAARALLDPELEIAASDVTFGEQELSVEATLHDGREISLADRDGAPPVVHFPADLRGGSLVAGSAHGAAGAVRESIEHALERSPAPRVALVRGLEACVGSAEGVVFAIEEPELYLAPQGHRYLYRLVHRLAERGNQVFFTTHSPGLLNVAALEEVSLVTRDDVGVTAVEGLRAIDVDDTFRALCEFDAERSELFFSRAAILVEGMTEKMTFPFVFRALGHDADREQISIVECGGKSNIPLFVEICKRARVPYVVVHDSDVRPSREPIPSDLRLNALIRRRAGARRTIVLEPDFEGVAGFRSRHRKPERAQERLGNARRDELPPPLVRVVELAIASARLRPPTYS